MEELRLRYRWEIRLTSIWHLWATDRYPKRKPPGRGPSIDLSRIRLKQRLPPTINVAIPTRRDLVHPMDVSTIRPYVSAPDRFEVSILSIAERLRIDAVRIGQTLEMIGSVSIVAWMVRFPPTCQDLANRRIYRSNWRALL